MDCVKLKFMMQCETLRLTENHAQYWGNMRQGSKVMDNFRTEVTHISNRSICLLFQPLHVQEKLTLNSQEISRVGLGSRLSQTTFFLQSVRLK